MAVTVVKRPTGHKIVAQPLTATITNSVGVALVTSLYHGLGTGDTVYIDSDIDEYNGFWYVTTVDSDQFKISEYDGADYVEYYQDLDIEYYNTNDHDWNSIFLPIVYKCSNTRWPINTVDFERTISSFSDDNGYTEVITSAAIKLSVQALEFVKISDSSDEDLNGVWQIVEVTGSGYVLDLPYDSSNDLVGATIQYYYNNYQVKVKVYGGLPTTHPWYTKKPYTEVAELSLTPDEDGIVMFSISDYIKSKVSIKNNPTIFTYPLNLDAFTGFYIATTETFDDSDGYTLTTNESQAYTDDTFNGYAIAGKLPFKNMYSGDYAEYVYTDGAPALWLTLFDRLLGIENKYFDISFIKNMVGNFTVNIDKYVSDYLTTTETVAYDYQGIGVYRIPIEFDSVYDSFCITVIRDADTGFTPAVMDAIDTWTNVDTGGEAWVLNGAVPEIDFDGLGLGVFSDDWRTTYAFEAGRIYSFGYSFKGSNSAGVFWIEILDSSFNVLLSLSIPTNPEAQSGTYSFTAPVGAAGINIWFDNPASCGGECLARIITFTNDTVGDPVAAAYAITEEICIDIIEDCEAASGFTPTDIRLLEDGSYRLLE